MAVRSFFSRYKRRYLAEIVTTRYDQRLRRVGDPGNPPTGPQLITSNHGAADTNALVVAVTAVTGDLLLCIHGNDFDTLATLTIPTASGQTFAEILAARADGGTNGAHLKAWTTAAQSTGSISVTFNQSAADDVFGAILVYRDPLGTPVVDVAASGTGTAQTSHVAPSVTTGPPIDDALVCVWLQMGVGTYTVPVAMNIVYQETDAVSSFARIAVATEKLGVSGATGTRTATTTSSNYVAHTIAVRTPLTGTSLTADDPAGLTDTSALGRTLAVTDSAGLTDAAPLTRSLAQTDAVGLTDAAGLTLAPALTDAAGLTDTSTVDLSKLVTSSDNAGLTDTSVLDRVLVFTDDAGLTDTPPLTRSAVLTDSAGLTDSTLTELVRGIAQTDSAGLADSAPLDRGIAATDSSGLTDSSALAQAKAATDAAGLTDTSALELAKLVASTDLAGLTDTSALNLAPVATDLAGLTDTSALAQSRVQTDSAGLTDAATADLGKLLTQTDSAGLSDSATRQQSIVVTDSAGLTDSPTNDRTLVLVDLAGLSDSATAVIPGDVPVLPPVVGFTFADAAATGFAAGQRADQVGSGVDAAAATSTMTGSARASTSMLGGDRATGELRSGDR